jgi:hypothetical protein
VLGWCDVKIDIGIMMCASVALGIALEGTIHFLVCFRRGTSAGLNRSQAVRLAYEQCTVPMVQTTIIAGLGLSVFAFSTFTPTQQFGLLTISTMTGALVGDLLILPAILAGPLGFYFSTDERELVAKPIIHAGPSPVPYGGQIALQQRQDRFEPPRPEAAGPMPKLEFPVVSQPKAPPLAPRRVTPPHITSTDVLEGPHADLHARLRNLRRDAPPERTSS